MSEHLPPRSSVGSRGSALPSHHHHLPPHPRPRGNADPLASVWIRRLHLAPNPALPPPPPPPLQDAVPTRSAGFGPFRWSPRPLRGAWDAAPAHGGSGGGPPTLSPFFRFPPPPPAVAVIEEFATSRPTIEFGSSSDSVGFPGLSSRTIVGGDPHGAWLATTAAGSAYSSHAVDMVPIRTSHDLHVRQHSMIPQNFARRAPSSSSMIPQNFAGRAPSSSSQHDEPFSYWNMGRLQRSTTTSSISQIVVSPSNFVKKRNADSNSFLPIKFRKLSGAG